MQLLAPLVALSAALAASAQMVVEVGGKPPGNLFMYSPNNITASNGTVITFRFSGSPGNHSVTQSTFSNPCNPMASGFDSGNVFIPPSFTGEPPTWNLTITDDTRPIWFFCKALVPQPHCQAGMVGGINVPTSGSNTLENFMQAAHNQQAPSNQGQGGLSGAGAAATTYPGPLPSGVTLATGAPLPANATSGSSAPTGSSSGSASAPSQSSSAMAAFGTNPLLAFAAVKVESSPTAKKAFLALANVLGYGSSKQQAGRRAFGLYKSVCAVKPDEDRLFWQQECHLPPTFQSWFTVTNLHVWLLTCRLRALPPSHGKYYIQALIDHFFIDVEDRVRAVLQPPAKPTEPYTFASAFYVNPNAPTADNPTKPRSRAPDRLVTRQMKIFKEQWAGMGLAFDLALVQGDMEMAAAVWRNLLGARGARGIAYPDPNSSPSQPQFRRSVNLVGGEVVNVAKLDLEKEEAKDDGSGVHDFPSEDVDKYVKYPEVMLDVVGYVRKELVRLEKLSDKELMNGALDAIKFGKVGVRDV
ncbi:hypothetical protein AMATHDRAFT_42385 [Amanita thiersii Skay4041]|uniref:Ubiquinol-cytochrome c chaperone domain-containing protein n=1 Tax=Amanita thiersii Skay4041 TaxID=703135 RepID=A0A2A9NKP4_9AGAR|nr:hypothetical protein AMATHDRAFT_42385 [Amanita thiersii Skay4041]